MQLALAPTTMLFDRANHVGQGFLISLGLCAHFLIRLQNHFGRRIEDLSFAEHKLASRGLELLELFHRFARLGMYMLWCLWSQLIRECLLQLQL